ncbi:MAG: hypothetical protein WCL20_03880 [Actinomycetes bacterium]
MTPPRASTAAGRLTASMPSPAAARSERSARRSSQASLGANRRDASAVGQYTETKPMRQATGARRMQRRISGPAAAGRAAVGSAQAAVAYIPESIPNPVRLPAGAPIGRKLAVVVRNAPDLAITHRIAKGRTWIGLLAAALIGIVFLQVMLLDMNSGIGRDIGAVTQLQRDNAELRSEVSSLGSDRRIVAEAQRMGFVEPPVGSSRFTSVTSGDAERAATAVVPAAGGPDGPVLRSLKSGATPVSVTQGSASVNPGIG